ncbi:MAG TPA: hypothetical protein VGG11_19390 [Xanthobacteraceae bacterium]
MRGSNIPFLTIAILFAGAVNAGAGPCTTQIVQIERSIQNSAATPTPDSGASAPQSVGAQLHHQPTPGSVEGAENRARADGLAALERARKADAAGDAAGCAQAIADAKLIYGLN